MFCGIASVLVMIYWDAGPPSAVFFFLLFLYLLPFKVLTWIWTDRQTVTYSEEGDEA